MAGRILIFDVFSPACVYMCCQCHGFSMLLVLPSFKVLSRFIKCNRIPRFLSAVIEIASIDNQCVFLLWFELKLFRHPPNISFSLFDCVCNKGSVILVSQQFAWEDERALVRPEGPKLYSSCGCRKPCLREFEFYCWDPKTSDWAELSLD